MSSRSPNRSDGRLRRAAAALVLGLAAAPWPGAAPAAAAVPLPVAAVFTGGGQTTVVTDLSASTRPAGGTVTVTRDGAAEPAELVPVVSADLAVALVVDSAAAGAATLPAWLSAGARFILEAPPRTRAVVIADSAPAAAVGAPQRGPLEIVRALNGVRAHGERDTAAALALAAGQFPGTAAGRRVVVFYTGAADAGGPGAAALAESFRAGGTILVVVGTAAAAGYWAPAATATGGFFAPAGDPVVVPALDQVRTTLNGRYLVRFRTPPELPARVGVRVDTGDLTLAGDVLVTAPAPAATGEPNGPSRRAILVGVLAAAVLLALFVIGAVRLRSRRSAGEGPGPAGSPTPARKAPAQKVSAQKVPAQKVPAQKVSAQKVPTQNVPAQRRPAPKGGPAQKGPARERPVRERAAPAAPPGRETPAPAERAAAAERSDPVGPASETPVARGRAGVPRTHLQGGVARGRAAVPEPGTGGAPPPE
jgi:hypothetical protein